MENKKIVLSVLVNNESGVLTRVSGLFARRGFNIDSLSVGETEEHGTSRITITATGDDYTQNQLIKQLEKLHDVKKIEAMDKAKTVMRELLLIKLMVAQGERSDVMQAVSVFRGNVIDLSPESMTIEITGECSKLDGFVEYLKPYKIAEFCRTGVTAIGRGSYIL